MARIFTRSTAMPRNWWVTPRTRTGCSTRSPACKFPITARRVWRGSNPDRGRDRASRSRSLSARACPEKVEPGLRKKRGSNKQPERNDDEKKSHPALTRLDSPDKRTWNRSDEPTKRRMHCEETAHHIRLSIADGGVGAHGRGRSRSRAGQEAQHRLHAYRQSRLW